MMLNVIKIFLPTTLAFAIGIAMTPRLVRFMHSRKLWKKVARTESTTITNEEFLKINNTAEEISTPRIGGVLIWLSVILTISLIWIISKIAPSDLTSKLDFYSRSQTLVPLGSLILASLLGLIDDMIEIKGRAQSAKCDTEIIFRYIKIGLIVILGGAIGYWFYSKLGVSSVVIPFANTALNMGLLFIPFFVLVLVAVFSGGVIDGMDGLAGGVLAIIFAAYAVIAFGQHQIDIAALCGVITGAILTLTVLRFWISCAAASTSCARAVSTKNCSTSSPASRR